VNKLLELKNISANYKKNVVIKNINLSIKPGEKIALVGKSGSGKSTLISIANGSLQAREGDVFWKGQKIHKLPKRELSNIGTIWQELALIEELNIAQNINCGALGKHNFLWALKNLFGVIDKELCEECLSAVYLPKKALYSHISKLSGGQKKRVAIARLLRQEAEIVLGDEPFSNLDPHLAKNILNLLINKGYIYNIRIPKTIFISLHQLNLINHFDRIIALKDGEIVMDKSIKNLKESQLDWIF
tara:strand:+ start:2062 stop:2796 length:735 start_codon:yes stop_codon:yes gene_type:complete